MTVLDRYLLRQVLGPLAAGVMVVLVLYSAFSATALLREASATGISFHTLLQLTLVRNLIALEVILPSAFFLAIIVGFAAWHRDREAYAAYAVGISPGRVAAPLLVLGLLVAGVVACLSLLVRPVAYQSSYALQEKMLQLAADVMQPGRFYRWNEQLVIYAARVADGSPRLLEVFAAQRTGSLMQVIRSERAHVAAPDPEERQEVRFYNGVLYELAPNGRATETRFATLKFATDGTREEGGRMKRRAEPHASLVASDWSKAKAELQWRYNLPLMTLALAFVAVRVGRARPGQSLYARIALGTVIYVLVFNLFNVAIAAVENEQLPAVPGVFLVPLSLLGVLVALQLSDRLLPGGSGR